MITSLVSLLLLFTAGPAPRVDAYVRQPIDVEHYRFALTLADSTDRISGEATVRMRVLSPGLSTVWLDLANVSAARQGQGMSVSSVTRGGVALRFTHANDRLTMTLDRPSRTGEITEVVVRYAGIPADGMQIKNNKHGDRTFFSDDWPNRRIIGCR